MSNPRSFAILISVLLAAGTSFAQHPASPKTEETRIPAVVLRETDRFTVPMSGPQNVGVGLPMFCSPQNVLFMRLITQTAVIEVVSIGPDGKTVTHFSNSKITDVPNPRLGAFFLSGEDVYVQATGFSEEESVKVHVPHNDGTVSEQKGVRYKGVRTYIAHFKADGRYVGAVPLDLDFRLIRFGVFPSGEILVSGMKDAVGEARLALFQTNGQILRYLQPGDDISRDSPEFKQQSKDSGSPLSRPETFLRVMMSSTIIPDGSDLILLRPGTDPRIYSVTAGGEVVRRKLQLPGKYSLFGLIATPAGWIGQVSQSAGGFGMKFMLFLFDRYTGEALREYQYPGPFGLGLACSDGADFLFLRGETEDSFTLVRAQPVSSQ